MDTLKSIFYLFLIFLSFKSYALDTKVSLELSDKSQNWDVGEIKDIQITLYPISDVIDTDLKTELLSREFIDLIKIVKVNKQYFLKTNPEYYIIEATAVLARAPKENFPRIWTYKGMALGVDLSKVSLVSEPAKIKDFIVFDKSVNQSKTMLYVIILVGALVLIFIAFLIFEKYKSKRAYEMKRKTNVENFKNASQRKDHELIYENQEIYKEFFDMNGGFAQYLKAINEIQYKRDWSNDDLALISKAHSEVKEKIIAK